jgi:hypothetical protein
MSKDIVKANTPKMEDKPSIEAQIVFIRSNMENLETWLTLADEEEAKEEIEKTKKEVVMLRTIAENLITLKLTNDANRRAPEGKRNIYECAKGHKTVTVDTAEGVTAFTISCPACEESGESVEAFSSFYRVPQTSKPTHEWYKPTKEDLIKLQAECQPYQFDNIMDHVNQGGLLFRKIQEVSNG